MKKIKLAVVGYGNRGQVYADYSLDEPSEVEVVAVVDPNPFKHEVVKERYGLKDNQVFFNWNDFLKANVEADIVVNATMDQTHYETAMQILSAKYNMLMEKPVVNDKDQLLEIQALANKNKCLVFVCHVLRYTPFYRTIKTLINQGEIGTIMTMEMNEHVCIPHYLTSYDRGKWGRIEECGSGFLLAKCCHDMDLITWLNNASKPLSVASFSHRKEFVPENKPAGATKFCYECPHEKTCQYSALNYYYYNDVMPFLTWDRLNKPLDEITKEEKMEFLKKDIYGQCAYDCGGTIADRQNLIVDFENGSVVSFCLSGGTVKPDRYIHVVGNKGEIEGKIEENKFIVRHYDALHNRRDEKVYDMNDKTINNARFGGHSGGDYAIMHDLVRYLNGDRSSVSITSLDDSVNGHLVVYAAEESAASGRIVKVK